MRSWGSNLVVKSQQKTCYGQAVDVRVSQRSYE
jgi:hypothetical protein